MNKKPKKIIHKVILNTRTALAVGSLSLLMAACGGENADVPTTEKAEQTTSPATAAILSGFAPDELSKILLDGKYKELYARFNQPLKDEISEAELTETGKEFTKGIHTLEKASTMQLNGFDRRTWVSDAGNKGLVGMFDPDGTITLIQVQELTPSPETDNVLSKHEYALPFEGDWYVFWGGENVLVNYHYELEIQRYAYDFIQTKDNYSYTGDPLKNESYYAFGKNILAPADGTVVSVVNDIKDNEPVGVMNPNQATGNIVVIDHGGEYSHLAHLKHGSVTVKPGDKVEKGEVIGLTGNSGNTSEAHLHFQISDGADLFTSRAIRVKWEQNLKPIQGETISAAN
ncbi:M23 family metallopeptidase [Paenibacillus odorifer]|uniref:M23 family metallopeptidase n=1 Tax=Paenibacillus odorifer TaxID=189426 RepID=UPI00096E3887|nr:M23 family metallopeptidase [Paenibacillus odorifer]